MASMHARSITARNQEHHATCIERRVHGVDPLRQVFGVVEVGQLRRDRVQHPNDAFLGGLLLVRALHLLLLLGHAGNELVEQHGHHHVEQHEAADEEVGHEEKRHGVVGSRDAAIVDIKQRSPD